MTYIGRHRTAARRENCTCEQARLAYSILTVGLSHPGHMPHCPIAQDRATRLHIGQGGTR